MRPEFEPGWIAHRIIIEQPARTADDAGGSVTTWSMLAAVWAAIEPVRAAVDTGSDRLGSVITHRVTIRHRDDVVAGMRIRHRGRLLAIDTVTDPDERRRFLLIEAREEAS
ncbi:phage head-tail adaptor, putative, SPP1 family [Kaistia soli DSM 19436]|uniref:Phage head-tail adaptor, putative, SPP1 family n=1 Tax=Kaistia soli DSM 19436 TaxID=1122133 RepID=A0A1M4UYP1_9HYPH|nr:phage head closure protein [Kaistia soli]SHE61871.1 phage head-tail adaptor, putative, SPP1 family [Kaistia soli DSM 19436]